MNWNEDIRGIGDRIAALTLGQAFELGDYLERVHGVKSAGAPVVLPDVIVGPGEDKAPAEPTDFAVVLEGFNPANKIGVIKGVREITGLGLKEAKETVEGFPRVIKESLPKAEAEKLKSQLEAAGAKVSLKPV